MTDDEILKKADRMIAALEHATANQTVNEFEDQFVRRIAADEIRMRGWRATGKARYQGHAPAGDERLER